MDAIKSWFIALFTKIFVELKSRKFWALVAAIVTAAQARGLNEITDWQFVMAVVAALSIYSTGIALVKAATLMGNK